MTYDPRTVLDGMAWTVLLREHPRGLLFPRKGIYQENPDRFCFLPILIFVLLRLGLYVALADVVLTR